MTHAVPTRPIQLILRLEGLALAALATTAFAATGSSWTLFAALLLLPDLSIAGYLAGPRAGAAVYNLFHSYALPLTLALAAYLLVLPGALPLTLVWVVHIGLDRGLGYGLKQGSGFRMTHLGRI